MSDDEGSFDYCDHDWIVTDYPHGWRKECNKCHVVLGGS